MGVPPFSEQTFLLLRQFADALSAGKHLVFHCRQGIGRSSLMAAGALVLVGLAPEQAFERLSQARGRPVPETEGQREWVVALARRK
jgi:predicted protein tyrosine phosphatase